MKNLNTFERDRGIACEELRETHILLYSEEWIRQWTNHQNEKNEEPKLLRSNFLSYTQTFNVHFHRCMWGHRS